MELSYLISKLREKLEIKADEGVAYTEDDFNPCDQFGGTFDAAYWGGGI